VIGDGGPGTPVMLGRLKRMKSLQPKPFEESVARSVERKKRQRFTKESLNKENCGDLFEFPSHDNDEIILLNDSVI
jgi:microcephalin